MKARGGFPKRGACFLLLGRNAAAHDATAVIVHAPSRMTCQNTPLQAALTCFWLCNDTVVAMADSTKSVAKTVAAETRMIASLSDIHN
jgi:hypothetical protein